MDCLEGLKQLDNSSVDCIITDPPYNMDKAEWDTIENFDDWIRDILVESVRVLKPNKALWIFSNHYSVCSIKNILDDFESCRFRSWIIWNKGAGTPNVLNFTNTHEQILYYLKIPSKRIIKSFGEYIKKRRLEMNISLKEIGYLCQEKWYYRGGQLYFETGMAYPNVKQYLKLKEVLKLDNSFDIYFDNNFIFNLESIGVKWKYEKDKRNKKGWKNPSDVWDIPQLSGTFKERVNHPTQKPLKLIKRIIKVSSNEGDVILDLFMGSGTTAVACKQLSRKFIGFEFDKDYCKIANKRLQQSNLKTFV